MNAAQVTREFLQASLITDLFPVFLGSSLSGDDIGGDKGPHRLNPQAQASTIVSEGDYVRSLSDPNYRAWRLHPISFDF